jgi:hypothetical protein
VLVQKGFSYAYENGAKMITLIILLALVLIFGFEAVIRAILGLLALAGLLCGMAIILFLVSVVILA